MMDEIPTELVVSILARAGAWRTTTTTAAADGNVLRFVTSASVCVRWRDLFRSSEDAVVGAFLCAGEINGGGGKWALCRIARGPFQVDASRRTWTVSMIPGMLRRCAADAGDALNSLLIDDDDVTLATCRLIDVFPEGVLGGIRSPISLIELIIEIARMRLPAAAGGGCGGEEDEAAAYEQKLRAMRRCGQALDDVLMNGPEKEQQWAYVWFFYQIKNVLSATPTWFDAVIYASKVTDPSTLQCMIDAFRERLDDVCATTLKSALAWSLTSEKEDAARLLLDWPVRDRAPRADWVPTGDDDCSWLRTDRWMSFLSIATCAGPAAVELLLTWPEHPARADQLDGEALLHAADNGRDDVVRLLLGWPEHAPKADCRGGEALTNAIYGWSYGSDAPDDCIALDLLRDDRLDVRHCSCACARCRRNSARRGRGKRQQARRRDAARMAGARAEGRLPGRRCDLLRHPRHERGKRASASVVPIHRKDSLDAPDVPGGRPNDRANPRLVPRGLAALSYAASRHAGAHRSPAARRFRRRVGDDRSVRGRGHLHARSSRILGHPEHCENPIGKAARVASQKINK